MNPEKTLAPSVVRQIILNEHNQLREKLSAIETSINTKGFPNLATLVQEMISFLLKHMENEEKILLPSLKDIDAWGAVRVDRLNKDHKEQRQEIQNLLDLLKREKIAQSIPAVQKFVSQLLLDIVQEEQDFLSSDLLKDDPITVGTFSS